jgi:predicted ribosome quality control (RQC) complex YloA/Tae2 family protein
MKVAVETLSSIPVEIVYYIGRSQSENFAVIDLGAPEDIWFHVAGEASCHVVAAIPDDQKFNKKQMLTILKRGALLCKQHTNKVAKSKDVEITYAPVKNVHKTDTPGKVIVNHSKSIYV